MPRPLKAKDATTGETISFTWHDDTRLPTDEEMDQIAAEWRQRKPAAPPSLTEQIAASDPNYISPAAAEQGSKRIAGVGKWVSENPGTTGAMVGSAIAAPFTGGMSLGGVMLAEGTASALGNAAGHIIKRYTEGEEIPYGDIAKDSLLTGGASAATAGLLPLGLKAVGKGAYHLALKPRLSMSHTPEEVGTLVKTGLDEGISVSASGFQKAGELIKSEAEDVRKLIASLNASGTVEKGLAKIEALKNYWMKRGVLDEKIAALDDVAAQYTRRYGDTTRPMTELHDLKQGIWSETQNNWDKALNPAKIEAQKQFGSGLRETIEEAGKARGVTTIGEKNARIGRLGELQDTISGRAAHEAMPGLRQGVEMIGGASPGYLMRAVATSSPVLSTAGRALHAAGEFLDPRNLRPLAAHAPGAVPKRTPAGLLPPAPTILGPGADTSFVRGVPAKPAVSERLALPPARTIEPLGPIPDTSGPIRPTLPENYGKTAGGLDIPTTGEPYAPNGLDRLDIPPTRDMYSPEELWLKKLLTEQNPKLVHLPFEKWKALLKEAATSGAYKAKVAGQPNVRITKDKVQELYQAYLQQR